MIRNRSVPSDTVLPHILYRDVAEAVDWLTRTFGFSEHYRYGDPVSGAQIYLGDAYIMLKRAAAGPAGGHLLTVFVEDVAAHYANSKSAGACIVEELNETCYGERQYAAEDFAGHRWLFSQHIYDFSPTEWGASLIANR
jgi:uncharacterized glyoxalase superfamily protein PhnB